MNAGQRSVAAFKGQKESHTGTIPTAHSDVLQTYRETILCVSKGCSFFKAIVPSFYVIPSLSVYIHLFPVYLSLFYSFPVSVSASFCHSIFTSSSFIVLFLCLFLNLFHILFTSSLSCFLSVLFSLFLVVCQISSVMSLCFSDSSL